MIRPTELQARNNVQRAIPFLWLALSAGWLVVLFVTDIPAWPLAIWIATTLGPLSALQRKAAAPSETTKRSR